MKNYRLERVESMIAQEISALIVSGKIKDYRVSTFLSVTSVKVAKDLSFAKVTISSHEGKNKLDKGVEGLNSAAGFIQREVGSKLKTRLTPRIRFYTDDGIEYAANINKLIDSVIENKNGKESTESD